MDELKPREALELENGVESSHHVPSTSNADVVKVVYLETENTITIITIIHNNHNNNSKNNNNNNNK